MALLVTGFTAAHAGAVAPLSPDQVELRARVQAKQQARQHAQQQAKRQSQDPVAQYNLDIKAPELKRIALSKPVVRLNSEGNGELLIDLSVVDNLTGVASAEVSVLHQASEWGTWTEKTLSVPQTHAKLGVQVIMSGELPAGDWIVSNVTLRDANDNVRQYNAAALAALGNTSFQVESRAKLDGEAPSLTGGSVLTPVVSRSTPPKGEYPGRPARLGLSLAVTDTGATKTSGLGRANVTLCDDFQWECIYLSGTALRPGAASGSILVGGTLDSWTPSNRYTVYSVRVYDVQGNSRYYEIWDTDFNAMFGGDASITIND
ncbi:hypothetical protein KAK06_18785 [Ideonella sp. 4Y11]|uniref:Uncharacterized protein n=1 Tax=Ideonella aquatica TaxID=2824119 RepID=A0A940YN90_9BURK|nr:hypothetical protein [Ideonella aquatica]MBQ0961009.1 hypothetical protein [Ideonella aquatica]